MRHFFIEYWPSSGKFTSGYVVRLFVSAAYEMPSTFGLRRALEYPQVRCMPAVLPKVLVVDDDEESRRLLSEVLEANGYEVDAVEDGVAAREALARDGEFRIIIADLRMPHETGLELMRNLRRQNSKHP